MVIDLYVTGASVRGASHARSGSPNQDAIAWLPENGNGPRVVLAVADGHGSNRSFRSDVGAQLAVEVATGMAWNDLASVGNDERGGALEAVAGRIVAGWRDAVAAHLEAHPFTDDDSEPRDGEIRHSLLAYGATLLLADVTQERVAVLQLGDGDVVVVGRDGVVTRPLPADARLVGNETTSLCMENAEAEFRSTVLPVADGAPALVLMATDGCSNSFANEEAFLQVGTDLLSMIAGDGISSVAASLAGLLEEMTAGGSGDDTTLGVVWLGDRVA